MGIDWGQALTAGLIAGGVPLLLRYLGKVFPPNTVSMPTEEEFPISEVPKWNFISVPFYLGFTAIGGGCLWLLLDLLFSAYQTSFEGIKIFIGVPSSALAIPALFAGMVASYKPTIFVLRSLLKDRYALYSLASTRQFGGMDSERMMKSFSVVVLTGVVICIALLFRAKILIYSDHLVTCGPVSCQAYFFEEIIEVGQSSRAHAPNGNIVPSRDLYLRFKDGSIWSPFLLRGNAIHDNVANFLTQKTGLQIQSPDLLPEH